MVHTKNGIGRKLKTKCLRLVMLQVDKAIKLHILTDSKIQNKQIP